MNLRACFSLSLFVLVLSQPARAAEELNLFGWSEYVPQAVLDGFTKATGIKVNFETYSSNEELLAKLVAGGSNYDLVQPSDYTAEVMIRQKLLAPLDAARLPNLKNLDAAMRRQPHDPEGRFTVPYMSGTVGIVVNTEKVKTPVTGYRDFFQPRFKERIVVLNDSRELVTWALYSQGAPINTINAANLAKVKPVLAEWVKLVKVFDSDSPKTALLNGDVAVGVVWGGEGAILLNKNKKFRWIIPAEGSHMFIDSLAIPKAAKNVESAEEFMNFILRPEISKEISEEFPYLNPNLAARALMTKKELENPASFPTDEEMKKMQLFKDIGTQASEIEEIVTTLKAQ